MRVAPALVVRPAKHRERDARDSRTPRARHSDAQREERPAQPPRGVDGEAAGGDGTLGLVGGVFFGGAGRALVGDAALEEVQPYPRDREQDAAQVTAASGRSQGAEYGLWV